MRRLAGDEQTRWRPTAVMFCEPRTMQTVGNRLICRQERRPCPRQAFGLPCKGCTEAPRQGVPEFAQAAGDGAVLFNVQAEVEEGLFSTCHRLALQAPGFTHQPPLRTHTPEAAAHGGSIPCQCEAVQKKNSRRVRALAASSMRKWGPTSMWSRDRWHLNASQLS